MKPLIIDCSPRVNGNSDIIADIISHSRDVDIIRLRDYEYRPCIGCESCSKTGKCIYNDKATEILHDIELRDKVIFVAPVYFYNFNAHAKALIDRAQYKWASRNGVKNLKIYLISCGGQTFADNFDSMVKTLKCFALTMEGKYSGGLFFPGVDGKGEIDTEYNRKKISDFIDEML